MARDEGKALKKIRVFLGSLVFPVETDIASKTEIDSKELTDFGFDQNANFHGEYQRAKHRLSGCF